MKRIFLGALLAAILSGIVLGQGQRRDQGSALKNALGLTDAQVESIKALVQNERTQTQTIFTEIEQKRQALEALLNAASPSAVDVGNAAIALHASENKLQAERTALINQIKQQLTGEQQQKLDTLLAQNGGRGLPIPGLGFGPGGPRGRGGRGLR